MRIVVLQDKVTLLRLYAYVLSKRSHSLHIQSLCRTTKSSILDHDDDVVIMCLLNSLLTFINALRVYTARHNNRGGGGCQSYRPLAIGGRLSAKTLYKNCTGNNYTYCCSAKSLQ
jgi:hypothetical protein